MVSARHDQAHTGRGPRCRPWGSCAGPRASAISASRSRSPRQPRETPTRSISQRSAGTPLSRRARIDQAVGVGKDRAGRAQAHLVERRIDVGLKAERQMRMLHQEAVRGSFIPIHAASSVILVDQPAESIDANDHAVTSIPGGAGLRRLEREATVRSFFVVVPEVRFENPPQMALPEDQGWSMHSRRTVFTKRSAKAFACGERMGVRTTCTPSPHNTSSNGP